MENLLNQILPSERQLFCNHCKKVVIPKLSKAGPHIRADCSSCNRFLKFARRDKTTITPGERDTANKYFKDSDPKVLGFDNPKKDYDPKEKGLDNVKGRETPPWE